MSAPVAPEQNSSQPNRNGFGQRLALVKRDQSSRTFAAALGMAPNSVNNYLSGKSEPTRPVLEAIARSTGVSLDWLVTGKGPMRPSSPAEVAAEIQLEIGPKNVVLIPFYGENEVIPTAFSYRWIRDVLCLDHDYLALMRMPGDSMVPTIDDGSIIFFDTSEPARQPADGIFVIRLDGVMFVKRLQRAPGAQFKIISDNRAYDPYLVPMDGADFAIVGRPEFCISRL